MGDYDQTDTDTLLGRRDYIWWPWPHFQGHTAFWNFRSLTQKRLSAPYLLNQMMDSGQTSYIVMLGWLKDLIIFWWPWPYFQGHHTIKIVKMSLVCTLSPEPVGGFLPNLHRNTSGTWERNDFGDLDLIFKVTPALWMSNFDQKKLVCTLSLEHNDGFRPNFIYYIIGIIKRND